MAIIKAVNGNNKTKAGLKGVIKYVLQENKTSQTLVSGVGDFLTNDTALNSENTYKEFLRIKKLFNKDTGRQYMHVVMSFAPHEGTPEQIHRLGVEFAEKTWPNHQVLVVTHTDREHLHNHFVINSVSYIDGNKLHWKKEDLQKAKEYCVELCKREGLHIAKKGEHVDGTPFKKGDITVWSKNLYHLLERAQYEDSGSYVLDCANTIIKAAEKAADRLAFCNEMSIYGWKVTWSDSRKYITFENSEGKKVRNRTLTKHLGIDFSKEALEERFKHTQDRTVIKKLVKDSENLRLSLIIAICKRMQTEEALNELHIKYSNQDILQLNQLSESLSASKEMIMQHKRNINTLSDTCKNISSLHPFQKADIQRKLSAEEAAINKENDNIKSLLLQAGYESEADFLKSYTESQNEKQKISLLKKSLQQQIEEQEQAFISYQESVTVIPQNQLSDFYNECTSLRHYESHKEIVQKILPSITKAQLDKAESIIKKSYPNIDSTKKQYSHSIHI